jgi:hypothetical protein
MPSMNTGVVWSAVPRTTSTPESAGARATPGMFCNARSASPEVPGTRLSSRRDSVRRVTSRLGGAPRTMIVVVSPSIRGASR